MRAARRVREEARRNGSIERRDRASGLLHHRLFSAITHNWRGRPLTGYEVVVNTIAATTTATGLTVEAELDTGTYPTGQTVTDAAFDALPIAFDPWHGDWNYTLYPQPAAPMLDCRPGWLHPDLLGLSAEHTAALLAAAPAPRTRNSPTAGDTLLATVLHHRYRLDKADIGTLLGLDNRQTGRAIAAGNRLIDRHTTHIPPPPPDHNPPTSPTGFTAWADHLTQPTADQQPD